MFSSEPKLVSKCDSCRLSALVSDLDSCMVVAALSGCFPFSVLVKVDSAGDSACPLAPSVNVSRRLSTFLWLMSSGTGGDTCRRTSMTVLLTAGGSGALDSARCRRLVELLHGTRTGFFVLWWRTLALYGTGEEVLLCVLPMAFAISRIGVLGRRRFRRRRGTCVLVSHWPVRPSRICCLSSATDAVVKPLLSSTDKLLGRRERVKQRGGHVEVGTQERGSSPVASLLWSSGDAGELSLPVLKCASPIPSGDEERSTPFVSLSLVLQPSRSCSPNGDRESRGESIVRIVTWSSFGFS